MKNHAPRRCVAVGASLLAGLALAVTPASPAAAATGEASAFGGTITLGGQDVVPPTPAVQLTTPGDVEDTTIDIPADPLAVSGTLNAFASIHPAGDLESALESEGVEHEGLPGPYHARSEGLVEGAEVLLDAAGEGVPLVSADVIRGEAVAVCTDGVPAYSAASEIVNLQIGGQEVPLNGPLTQIIDGLNQVLAEDGLGQVASIQQNVVTEVEGGGVAVDALVVTVLAAAGDDPLGQVRLGHAQVSGDVCNFPECSDGIDNDGDGRIDFEAPEGGTPDPHCTSPDDDTEASQCTDGVDNEDPEDTRVDADDPGCPSDLALAMDDDDEANGALPGNVAAGEQLPATGSDDASTVALASVMGAAALGALALRRRLAGS